MQFQQQQKKLKSNFRNCLFFLVFVIGHTHTPSVKTSLFVSFTCIYLVFKVLKEGDHILQNIKSCYVNMDQSSYTYSTVTIWLIYLLEYGTGLPVTVCCYVCGLTCLLALGDRTCVSINISQPPADLYHYGDAGTHCGYLGTQHCKQHGIGWLGVLHLSIG